jgi:hypothetical protein
MHDSQLVGVRSPEFRGVLQRIKVATGLSARLSACGVAVLVGDLEREALDDEELVAPHLIDSEDTLIWR